MFQGSDMLLRGQYSITGTLATFGISIKNTRMKSAARVVIFRTLLFLGYGSQNSTSHGCRPVEVEFEKSLLNREFSMRKLLKKLFQDESGMIISSEIVIVGTILVIGSIVGLASLSHAVNNELNDVARACDKAYNDSSSGGYNEDDYTLTSSVGVPEMAGY